MTNDSPRLLLAATAPYTSYPKLQLALFSYPILCSLFESPAESMVFKYPLGRFEVCVVLVVLVLVLVVCSLPVGAGRRV